MKQSLSHLILMAIPFSIIISFFIYQLLPMFEKISLLLTTTP